ncbi:MAG: BREX-3 system P-loop-containing protein BrxF [Planctomycetota bacterium]
MAGPLSEEILARIEKAPELYHRLILLVAPSGSGKTAALKDIAAQTGASLLNLNLEVSRRLLDLTERQRALQLPRVLEEAVATAPALILLDNIEILFDVSLQQDPLRLLQGLSRNRTVVASWSGTVHDGYLTYAIPEHREYRRYPCRGLVIVCPEAAS